MTEECSTCKTKEFDSNGKLIPVWENLEDYKQNSNPDYIGCTDCNTMQEYNE